MGAVFGGVPGGGARIKGRTTTVSKLVEDSRGTKLQVTLGRAFIIGFGVGLGLTATAGVMALLVVLLAVAGSSGG
jgi:hypothetical protein